MKEEKDSGQQHEAKPPVMRWVAISERLPEMEVEVLLFDDWKCTDGERRQDMKVGYLSEFTTRKTADGKAYNCEWRGHEFLFNITHWMPLPEPPIATDDMKEEKTTTIVGNVVLAADLIKWLETERTILFNQAGCMLDPVDYRKSMDLIHAINITLEYVKLSKICG